MLFRCGVWPVRLLFNLQKREEIKTNSKPLDEGNSSKKDDVQSKEKKVDTAQGEDQSTKGEVPKGKLNTEQVHEVMCEFEGLSEGNFKI